MNQKDFKIFTQYVDEKVKLASHSTPAYQPIIIPFVEGFQIYNPRSMKTYFISHKEFWKFLEDNAQCLYIPTKKESEE